MLALTLLSKLDPTMEGGGTTADDKGLLPRFTKPKVLHATLPGQYGAIGQGVSPPIIILCGVLM